MCIFKNSVAATMLFVAPVLWAQDPSTSSSPPTSPAASATIEPENKPLTTEQAKQVVNNLDVNSIDISQLRAILSEEFQAEQTTLSLEECISITIASNPNLQVVRLEPEKSDADILTAKGEFDPVLNSTTSYGKQSTQITTQTSNLSTQLGSWIGGLLADETGQFIGSMIGSTLTSQSEMTTDVKAYSTTSKTAVSGKLTLGTTYDLALNLGSSKNSVSQTSEIWDGNLTLTLAQPLLQGRGAAVNLARVNIAKNTRKENECQVYLQVLTTVGEVIKAYWDLVGANENVRVRKEALDNAERLLDVSQKRYQIGTTAATEVLQAKAGLATRLSDLVSAKSRVVDAEDVLKNQMNMRDGSLFSNKRITPLNRPSIKEFKPDELKVMQSETEKYIDEALDKRPEMMMALLDIESAKLERERTANQMLPKVDLFGSVSQGGGDGSIGDALHSIADRDDHGYSIGIRGQIPIGNRVARGQYERANISTRQAELRLEKTKQELMLKVRVALRAILTNQILMESNRQARILQEKNVLAEEKRLKLGITTSYRVLQIQQDLTTAQTQESQAQIAYEKALVDLRLAEGTLLESLGVDFKPPEPLHPITFSRSLRPVETKE